MSTAAVRQRHYRQRRQAGRMALLIEIDDTATVEALIDGGFLQPSLRDDRAALADAIARLIEAVVKTA